MKEHAPQTKAPESAPKITAAPSKAVFSSRPSTHSILRLQRTIGNQAVQRCIQAKLMVGAANDVYEQEAERVAEQVMNMPASTSAGTDGASVQRRSSEDEQVTQAKPVATRVTRLAQAVASDPDGSFEPGSDFEAQLDAGSEGSPLPASARAFMEPRFGADLSGVRLHTGSEAAKLNRAINAQAFTHGADIYLGAGKNDTESNSGKQLLAHELAHVLQQNRRPAYNPRPMAAIQRKEESPVPDTARDQTEQSSPDSSAAPIAPVTWQMPFGLGVATNLTEAKWGLLYINDRLRGIEEWGTEIDGKEVQALQNGVINLVNGLPNEGPMTTGDKAVLALVGAQSENFYNDRVQQIAARLASALGGFFADVDTSVHEEAFAEELHNEYVKSNPDLEHIKQLKDGLDELQEYRERAEKVLSWGKAAADYLKAAKTVEALQLAENIVGKVENILGTAETMLDAAEVIRGIASKSGGAAGGSLQSHIEQMRIGLKAVNLVVKTFAKAVPLFGTLWSSYYEPLTQACLKGLEKIAKHRDLQGRELQLLDWWSVQHKGGTVPRIDHAYEQFFPGGQQILDYMYPLLNGGDPAMTPEVENYFISRRDVFNYGQDEKDRIAPAKHWYNPFTWTISSNSQNLKVWLVNNREKVWAQLYGRLPYTL